MGFYSHCFHLKQSFISLLREYPTAPSKALKTTTTTKKAWPSAASQLAVCFLSLLLPHLSHREEHEKREQSERDTDVFVEFIFYLKETVCSKPCVGEDRSDKAIKWGGKKKKLEMRAEGKIQRNKKGSNRGEDQESGQMSFSTAYISCSLRESRRKCFIRRGLMQLSKSTY